MESKDQPILKFSGVEIIRVIYNLKQNAPVGSKISMGSNFSVYYPEEEKNKFEIVTDLKIKCEEYFTIEVRAIGKFEVGEEITEEMKTNFININTPAMVFPYLRAFISTFTANTGAIGTVHLPPQFFSGSVKEIKKSELYLPDNSEEENS